MSKPRYKWWGFAKAIIRAYPEHCRDLQELHSQSITASIDATPKGGGISRTAENAALRELPPDDMREYLAVKNAVESTERTYKDADERLRMVDMVFFRKTHTLQGAANEIHISYGTAKKWHNKFIELTYRNFDR